MAKLAPLDEGGMRPKKNSNDQYSMINFQWALVNGVIDGLF